MPGTFEFGQLQSHVHPPFPGANSIWVSGLSTNTFGGGATTFANVTTTGSTGGSETRPVNTYIFPYIRY